MLPYGPEPCLKDLGVFGTLEIFHYVFCKCQKCQGIKTLRRQNIKPGQDSCGMKDHGSLVSYPSRSLEAGQRAPGGEPSNLRGAGSKAAVPNILEVPGSFGDLVTFRNPVKKECT